MIRAVLFDMDGTLIDSAPALTEAVNGLMRIVRMRGFTVEEVSRMIGKGARVLIERVCEARGIFPTEQTVSLMMREYANLMKAQDLPPGFYPGAMEGLDQLRAEGFKVGLVTNKMRTITEAFLERHDIAWNFDVVVCADDTPHPKPAPDMLLLAAKKLKVAPAELLMVGDSANDALAGRAAGAQVALVRTGYNEGVTIDDWAQANGFDCVRDDVAQVCADVLAGKIK